MIVELGHYALIVATLLSLTLCGSACLAYRNPSAAMLGFYRKNLMAIAACMLFAFALLLYAFATLDLTVVAVFNHAHKDLPLMYRLGALWGGHEGSMLLWVTLLSVWTATLSLRRVDAPISRLSGLWLGLILFGLLVYLLSVSNPFERYLPVTPTTGQDLNPLLQDPGLMYHPPLLYLGYVGFAMPFAFALSALVMGEFNGAAVRLMRKYVLLAWAFLTLGITLGSFWAYYELGWGGFWFWDPVENASLMPWITGTALLHSVLVTAQRKTFYAWTLLLCLLTFALSLLGTFLVRSGLLTSVHSFATDPSRGVFMITLLALYAIPALLLYAFRAHRFTRDVHFAATSKESLLLLNNVVFAAMAATLVLGTLYPLLVEAMGLGFISVGAPYFNRMMVPMGFVICFLVGFAPFLRWQKSYTQKISLMAAGVVVLMLPLVLLLAKQPLSFALTVLLAAWIVFHTALDLITRADLRKQPLSYWGMHLAHMGVAVLILGIGVSKQFEIEKDVAMSVNDHLLLNRYDFVLKAIQPKHGPNFESVQAVIEVSRDEQFIGDLKPEQRFYSVRGMPITETAIQSNGWRDLYAALAEPLPNNRWIIRLYYKPWVRFIWLGGVLMALGAALSWFDKRFLTVRRGEV